MSAEIERPADGSVGVRVRVGRLVLSAGVDGDRRGLAVSVSWGPR